jgi:predicted lipoprotein with Yx(FWY)xxD motif
MKNKRMLALSVLAPASLAVVAAGCGGSSAVAGAAYAPPKTGPVVTVAHTTVGNALVDAHGRSLYLFEKDKGTTSNCDGACASFWPPAAAPAKLVAGRGISQARLGLTRRKDGRSQVTYAGHPLYRYAGDAKPGDVRGQGVDQFGAKWYVLAPSGRKIDEDHT